MGFSKIAYTFRLGFAIGWLGFVSNTLLAQTQPNTSAAQTPTRYTYRRGLMGTQFTLILYATDSLKAQRAYQAVSARMDTLNHVMSDYLDNSEINRLSAAAGSGRWIEVSDDLWNVLAKAQRIARQSNGLFDPTVGPLSLLWRRAVRRHTFPEPNEIRHARKALGYRWLKLDSVQRRAMLVKPNMRLDVGGIGQGFAIDEAAKVLIQLQLPIFLLDIGGDLLAGQPPPENPNGWRIGIGDTATADTATVWLRQAAITTSGDTYRFLTYKGKRYSHIMNPRSGLGLPYLVRTTVLAPDGSRADALTKVFSVAGIGRSRRLVRRWPGVGVWMFEKKHRRLRRWQSAVR